MMKSVNSIIGLTFLIFQFKKTSILTEKIDACEVGADSRGTIVANCRATGIKSIPQNLGADIQILDISDNNETLTALNKDDLKNYPNLWGLIMKDLSVTSFPTGFFDHSTLLTLLNISNTHIENLSEIPDTITVLNLTRCHYENVDLSHLINIEKLYMRNCSNLTKVPALFSEAPLKVLDLKNCSLTEGNYSEIAPFCQLYYFGLESKHLSQNEYVFPCCGFRRWCIGWHMTGYQSQLCSRAEYSACREVPFQLKEEYLNAYKECARYLKKVKVLKIFGGVVAIVLLIGLIGYLAYRLFGSRFRAEKLSGSLAASDNEAETEADQDYNQ